MEKLTPFVQEHLLYLTSYYESFSLNWSGKGYRKILSYYYRFFIPSTASILEVGCGDGTLLALLPNQNVTGVDVSDRQIERAKKQIPYGEFHAQSAETLSLNRKFDYIILSDTINQAADVQGILENLHTVSHPQTRLVMNYYNNLWRLPLRFAEFLGWKSRPMPENWLACGDVRGLLEMTGWQIIKTQPKVLCPISIPIFERWVNRWIAPILPHACLTIFCLARSLRVAQSGDYSVSIIIPARNEEGNIDNVILRTPDFGKSIEFIFVEGHSKDDTWSRIQELPKKYPQKNIRFLQQTGMGKGNAVREGFEQATGEILMILDADLTMPPEELPKYYHLLASGYAEFANGVRLVYPMKEKAMRFLNLCANKVFSITFTWLLGQSVKDTLCGTKALFKKDYEKIVAHRSYFGDFDPFGDFDLLFGADKQSLKIVDIPIRYQDRSYGTTNIHRWKHGWLLLKMVVFAAKKLKFI